jgi:hypothetical protein
MPNEKTLDDEMRDDMDDNLPDIEISIFDDPDDRIADGADDPGESRPPTA